jgi:hypothetical protein
MVFGDMFLNALKKHLLCLQAGLAIGFSREIQTIHILHQMEKFL